MLEAEFDYRAMPFWAWNGKLEPEELRRQVRIMHDMGMNGFFMHSRLGLATGYLQEEWFECIKAALDEAEKLGMTASLYDEDRWPSGAAGGLATADERYRMRYLYCEMIPAGGKSSGKGETLGFYAVERCGDDVKNYRMITEAEAIDAAVDMLRIYRLIAPDQPGFNNAAYLNTLDKDAVKHFIELTHERYYDEIGGKFGKSVPYIFTDEPNYMDYALLERRPWTDNLPELYRERYGEDLTAFLPELFFSCGKNFSTVRYNFYKLVTDLFIDAFARQIGEWCEKHHIGLTGHVLFEDAPAFQVGAVGSAMQFYAHMHAPGIDVLTQYFTRYEVPIKAFSVARQYGREYVLSECYGCTGWDFPLYGHKAFGDWQYALGVNLRCQHLYWYTMLGEAKRDYPASIGGQSPWFEVYSQLEDYFARLGTAFAQAPSEIDLLVLYPLESAWGRAGYCARRLHFADEIDDAVARLTMELVCNHIPFDFGDEQILADTAAVENGCFRVNKVSYRTLLLPELLTIRSTTVKLLEDFCAAGGMVYTLGGAPEYCDGRVTADDRLKNLWNKFIAVDENILGSVLGKKLRKFSCSDADGSEIGEVLVRCGYCPVEKRRIMFAANAGTIPDLVGSRQPTTGKLRDFNCVNFAMIAEPGCRLLEIDLTDGTALAVNDAVYENGAYRWSAALAGNQSRLYYLVDVENAAAAPAAEFVPAAELEVKFKSAQLADDNLLVLDHASCRISESLEMENMYILFLDDKLRELLHCEHRSGNMLQPWFTPEKKTVKTLPLELTFAFCCETLPAEEVDLIIEQPELYRIKLNGILQCNQPAGYWRDPALTRVKLNLHDFRAGRNTITLETDYSPDRSGLEAIYLAGRFGAVVPDKLVTAPPLQPGKSAADLAIPFYSGNIIYNFEFALTESAPVEVILPEWFGSAVAWSVDGADNKLLLAQPWRFRTGELCAGTHNLQITLYGNCRNSMGPFYLDPMPDWIGPAQFKICDTREKQLVPFGMQNGLQVCVLQKI